MCHHHKYLDGLPHRDQYFPRKYSLLFWERNHSCKLRHPLPIPEKVQLVIVGEEFIL